MEKRTFYSKAQHYSTTISNPVTMMENGQIARVGGKSVEFQPLGDGYGWYNTAEPDEIAVLEHRPLVLSPEQYVDMTTPDAVKIQMEREEKQRLISDKNRLMAELDDLRSKAAKTLTK